MEVHCVACGQKANDTLGNLLVAGWNQRDEGTLSKRGWMCPSCVTAKVNVASLAPGAAEKP